VHINIKTKMEVARNEELERWRLSLVGFELMVGEQVKMRFNTGIRRVRCMQREQNKKSKDQCKGKVAEM
jgi:hypothetical protein